MPIFNDEEITSLYSKIFFEKPKLSQQLNEIQQQIEDLQKTVLLSSEFDYTISFRDRSYNYQKNTCYGDNEKGERLCKALSGRQLEQAGERIIYEL